MKKIGILVAITLILTILGDRASSALYQFQSNSFGRTLELIQHNFIFILITNILLYSLDMLRMKLIGKIFKQDFTWMDCFGGVSLNLLFGWISPMAILGAPAMAWYLFKKGYPLVESISVSFVRSFSIILTSALTTIFIFTFNIQGQIHNAVLQEKVFQVLTGIAIYITALFVLSYLPFPFIKNINVLDKITSQIRLLIRNGKFIMIPVFILTLALNFTLVSFIMYEGSNYHSQYTHLFGQVMLFLSYMLLMPTPGASGLAEVGAPMIFSAEIPRGDIISIVTAMRISTIGIQVTFGLIFIAFVLKQKISVDDIKLFKKQNG
jgi:uncharacterized membrane protein YbhN (UPF0104 family)